MNVGAAVCTLCIHGAVILAFLPSCVQIASPPPPPRPPEQDAAIVFVGADPAGTLACDSSYSGFGVMALADGKVWDVAPGSPADRAMIREGDIIENVAEFSPNTLAEGTEITLQVRRDGVLAVKHLRIGRICYQ